MSVRYEVDASIGCATITLDRPDSLNAFEVTMMRGIIDCFDRSDADDSVRSVVVTGAGRAFCAGADLAAGSETFTDPSLFGEGGAGRPRRDGGGLVTLRIFRSLKPVIAAINGPAVGIGATMTLPMDIRMASTTARIGFVFTKRGLVPEAASSWFLPRLVGISQAMEWVTTARVMSAAEAHAGGLLRSVHEPDELLSAAYELAAEMASGTAPVAVAAARQMLWRGLTFDHPMRAHRADSRGVSELGRSADVREGVASFLEKRPAVFPGRPSTDTPELFPDWVEPDFA